MGWASGSSLGVEIYDKIREYIPEDKRQEVAKFIYDAVCDLDADDWDGSSQLEIDGKVSTFCWRCDAELTPEEIEEGICKKCEGEL